MRWQDAAPPPFRRLHTPLKHTFLPPLSTGAHSTRNPAACVAGVPEERTLALTHPGPTPHPTPGVPEEFRDAVQSDASRSHEWRQKLVRLVVPRAGAAAAATSSNSERPPPSPVGATGGGWSNSFNLRSNKVADEDSPPKNASPL